MAALSYRDWLISRGVAPDEISNNVDSRAGNDENYQQYLTTDAYNTATKGGTVDPTAAWLSGLPAGFQLAPGVAQSSALALSNGQDPGQYPDIVGPDGQVWMQRDTVDPCWKSITGPNGGYTAQKASLCIKIPVENPAHITPHTEAFQAVIWHCLVSHPLLQKRRTKW